jgi:hypothetical protein
MVLGVGARLLARGYGLFDGFREASPLGAAQEQLEVASTPKLTAEIVQILERLKSYHANLKKRFPRRRRFFSKIFSLSLF